MWKPGDRVALRGIYNQRAWYVQSAVVVQDEPEEVALAIVPGAECFAPEGYINGEHGVASYYLWQTDKNHFLCYYINFQLPFRRNEIGFDTLDLELDIVIEPTYEWHWKDADDYPRGIECGILRKEWTQRIDAAKPEIFDWIEKRQYPFDGAWLDWMPDKSWSPPKLPENRDKA